MKLELRIVRQSKVLSLRYSLFRGFESKSESRRFPLICSLCLEQTSGRESWNYKNWKIEKWRMYSQL